MKCHTGSEQCLRKAHFSVPVVVCLCLQMARLAPDECRLASSVLARICGTTYAPGLGFVAHLGQLATALLLL